jgi:hypothetical protein
LIIWDMGFESADLPNVYTFHYAVPKIKFINITINLTKKD